MQFRELRHACSFPAELQAGVQRHAVVIVNAGMKGVRLGAARKPAPELAQGQQVRLCILGKAHPATVRWTDGGETGLRLEKPLGPSLLAAIRRTTGQRPMRGSWNLQLREL